MRRQKQPKSFDSILRSVVPGAAWRARPVERREQIETPGPPPYAPRLLHRAPEKHTAPISISTWPWPHSGRRRGEYPPPSAAAPRNQFGAQRFTVATRWSVKRIDRHAEIGFIGELAGDRHTVTRHHILSDQVERLDQHGIAAQPLQGRKFDVIPERNVVCAALQALPISFHAFDIRCPAVRRQKCFILALSCWSSPG
jgi:hypothetical protein